MGINLKEYNTFAIDAQCQKFVTFDSEAKLSSIFSSIAEEWMVVGGGSNILFTKDFNGTVIHPDIKGIEIVKTIGSDVYLLSGAGEVWDDLCKYAVENNLWGAENLSNIPGSVGASPVQNIGAYGCEAADIIDEVRYFDTIDKQFKTILGSDCQFDYRSSIFKTKLKNRCVICSVIFKLSTTTNPKLGYGTLQERVKNMGETTLANIRNAVIEIRSEKLPDPKVLGNGGSFFKNPVICAAQFQSLKEQYPTMPHYEVEDNYKIPAAWLIEQSGWKGKRVMNAGVHTSQPLVLVNYGGAKGSEIEQLSQDIAHDVELKFKIVLEREINIV